MTTNAFAGFPEETLAFLKGLSGHNDKAWFDAHRADYNSFYVGAARAFVDDMGPRLAAISPGVQFAAKVNGSIGRINRDVRFSRDKRPYKDYLDLWFWHGEKRGWDNPGFFFRLTPETVLIGVGMLGFPKPMLERYRKVVSDSAEATALKAVLAGVAASGPYQVAGPDRKTPPRGWPAEGDSAEMLRYEGLSAVLEWDNGIALGPDLVAFCLGHWRKCWPIGAWTLDRIWA